MGVWLNGPHCTIELPVIRKFVWPLHWGHYFHPYKELLKSWRQGVERQRNRPSWMSSDWLSHSYWPWCFILLCSSRATPLLCYLSYVTWDPCLLVSGWVLSVRGTSSVEARSGEMSRCLLPWFLPVALGFGSGFLLSGRPELLPVRRATAAATASPHRLCVPSRRWRLPTEPHRDYFRLLNCFPQAYLHLWGESLSCGSAIYFQLTNSHFHRFPFVKKQTFKSKISLFYLFIF